MASSYNGFRMKQKATIPASAGSGESILWINSSDSNKLYLNGDAVSSTPVVNPTVDPDFTGWTQTDQVGDGYTSSKQLSFNTTCLKEVATSATQTTLELADTITKTIAFNAGGAIEHTTTDPFGVSDVFTHCSMQMTGHTSGDVDSYTVMVGGFPVALGGGSIIEIGYALDSDSSLSRNVFTANANPSKKNIVIGDESNDENYIKFDCEHPNGGTFNIYRGGASKIAFSGTALTCEDISLSFGDASGTGDYIEVSSSGSLNGYHGGDLCWYISPDGSNSFGIGQNNTLVFNTQNDTGDVFSVTQNTISKVAKLSAETVNSVADFAWRVNTWMGAQYMEYNSKSLLSYIIDEVASYFNL